MATKMLESSAVSAFCESVAVMHSAGIQMDEAVFLLGENMEDAAFKRACDDVYKELIVGKPLALAMDDSGCFPSHVVDMAGAGEHAGRLENVLWSLARYYDEEDRLYAKIKNAIAYPAALLCVMSAILLFTVIVILPVFVDVYHGLTGNLTAGSFGYVNASIIIGWIALGVTLLCTVLVVLGVLAGRSAAGRQRLLRLFEKAPLTRGPMRQMAVSRFTAALATFVAAGVDTDTAMEKAVAMVDHGNLKSQLEAVRMQMTDPAQAKSQNRGTDCRHHGGNPSLAQHRIDDFHTRIDMDAVKNNRQCLRYPCILHGHSKDQTGESGNHDRQNSGDFFQAEDNDKENRDEQKDIEMIKLPKMVSHRIENRLIQRRPGILVSKEVKNHKTDKKGRHRRVQHRPHMIINIGITGAGGENRRIRQWRKLIAKDRTGYGRSRN